MADVKFEVVTFTTSSGSIGATQDVTISGFGTPKAAIFISSMAYNNDTIAAHDDFVMGFYDGTRNRAVSCFADDAVTTTDTWRANDNTMVLPFINQTGNIWHGMKATSFITDGVRLQVVWNTTFTRKVTCILIGGSDVANVYCNSYDDLGTTASTTDITDPGFEPDLLFLATANLSTAPDSRASHYLPCYGVALNDGSATQRSMSIYADDLVGTADNASYISNAYGVCRIQSSGVDWGGTVGFASDGFSVTTSADPSNCILYYLAIEFTNNPDLALFDLTIPTSGNYAETTPEFTPNFGYIALLHGPSSRNSIDSSSAYGYAIAAFDENNSYTASVSNEDGVTTTNTNTYYATTTDLALLDDTGTMAVAASSYTLTSYGWDFLLSTNPSSPVLGWGLAIGGHNEPVYSRQGGPFFIPDRNLRAPELLIPGRKPVGLMEVDWTHPLANGLQNCFLFPQGDPPENTVTWQSPTALSTSGVEYTPEGLLFDGASGNYFEAPYLAQPGVTTSEYTIHTITKLGSPSSSVWLWCRADASLGHLKQVFRLSTGGWRSRQDFTGGDSILDFGTDDADSITITVGYNEHKCYQDGMLLNSETTSGSLESTPDDYTIGSDSNHLYGYDGLIKAQFVFNRVLNEGEVASLARDPYQILKPRGT